MLAGEAKVQQLLHDVVERAVGEREGQRRCRAVWVTRATHQVSS